MPEASCIVPQMKSEAGVAANTRPLRVAFSPGAKTSEMVLVPGLGDRAALLLAVVGAPAFLVTGCRIGTAIGLAGGKIPIIPIHFADQLAADFRRRTPRGHTTDRIA